MRRGGQRSLALRRSASQPPTNLLAFASIGPSVGWGNFNNAVHLSFDDGVTWQIPILTW
jgi:hypothetical protein